MKRTSQIAMLLLLAALAVGPAWAQQSKVYRDGNGWVEEITGTLPAAKTVRVTTLMGTVRVQGGARSDIGYVVKKRSYASSESAARREFERFRVNASRTGDAAVIVGESDEHSFRRFSVDFALDVPPNVDARVDTQGGSVSVRGINGRADLNSGGGSLRLENVGGAVIARSGGGAVDVSGAGSDLMVKTGGGAIRVNSAKGRVEAQTGGGPIQVQSAVQAVIAQTGGGNIDLRDCQGTLEATTGGGSIDAGQIGGRARITTGGGSIHLSGANGPVEVSSGGGSIELMKVAQGARASTGAGTITAEFVGSGGTESSLSTTAGDVVVYLAPDVKATVNAAVEMAAGHRITSDFPELKITSEGPEYGPRTIYASGNVNGGGPTLRIRTTTGDIVIRRVKK